METKLKNYLLILATIISVGVSLRCSAQEGQPSSSPQKSNFVVPPSPTAASLGRYGEVPVGNFTGMANISIPLYEIQAAGFTLPVTLNYGYSGLRVNEVASWVGLGWSLSAGGVITREMRGKPDEHPRGYDNIGRKVPDPTKVDLGSFNNSLTDQERRNFADGLWDGIPDKYNFNFAGRSGQLVIAGDSIFTLPYMPLRIARSSPDNWSVTDENGVVFLFGKETANGQVIRDGTERTEIVNPCSSPADEYYSFISAWHLVRVTIPNGQVITLDYEAESITNVPIASYTADISGPSNGYCLEVPVTGCVGSSEPIYSKRLSRIKFLQGSVDFHASTKRLDVFPGDNAFSLDSITVKGTEGKIKKAFKLNYSYLGPMTADGKLLLGRVQEFGLEGASKEPYIFTYNTNGTPPSRGSFSQDHWGYFNNKGNSTLIPRSKDFLSGADRSPDFTSSQLGALVNVQYPTGGNTTFLYEPHTYFYASSFKKDYTLYNAESYRATCQEDPTCPGSQVMETPFTVEEGQYIKLVYSVARNNGMPALENDVAVLTSDRTQQFFYRSQDDGVERQDSVWLAPGTYLLRARAMDVNYRAKIKGSIFKTDPSQIVYDNRLAGGIRIRETASTAGDGSLPVVKEYLYQDFNTPQRSSGHLNAAPVYQYSDINVIVVGGDPSCVWCVRIECSKLFLTAHSLNTISSSWGHVTYPQVTVLEGRNGINGRTTYCYTPGGEFTRAGPPYVPVLSKAHVSGLLTEVTNYNNLGNKVKRSTRSYKVHNTPGVPNRHGVGVFGLAYEANYDAVQDFNDRFKMASYHGIFTDWVYQNSQTDSLFFYHDDAIGELSGTTVTVDSFFFDNPNHAMLTRTKQVVSNGRVIVSSVTYPDDYSDQQGFIAALRAEHILAPIEQVIYEEGIGGMGMQVLSGEVNIYKTIGKGLRDQVWKLRADAPIPKSSFKFSNKLAGVSLVQGPKEPFSADNRYGLHLKYDAYDPKGLLLQVTPTDNNATSYLWDYNNLLPVAQVVNASYSQIYHTSFEDSGTEGDAKTGRRYHTGTYTFTPPAGFTPVAGSLLSYWSWSVQTSRWTLVEVPYSGGNAICSGDRIDEVRIAPPGSMMTTYTYDPLVGVTSVTDQNGKTQYYSYDGLGRLMFVKDQDGNILQKYDYIYKQ